MAVSSSSSFEIKADPSRVMAGIAVPFQLRTEQGVLGFLSTTMVFGTPVDVTLSELAIEAFFPIDARTAEAMREIAGDATS